MLTNRARHFSIRNHGSMRLTNLRRDSGDPPCSFSRKKPEMPTSATALKGRADADPDGVAAFRQRPSAQGAVAGGP